MKRKEFFKTLFGVAAAAVVAPKILAKESEMPPAGKFKSTSPSICTTSEFEFPYDSQYGVIPDEGGKDWITTLKENGAEEWSPNFYILRRG